MPYRWWSCALVALMCCAVSSGTAAAQSAPEPVRVELDGFGPMAPNVCPVGDEPVINSYAVTGQSTGDYPGTFTATGDVYWDPDANTLELRNAGFTIESAAGRVHATLSSFGPTEEDEFSIYCSSSTESAFQSGFMATWHGTLTAPDGTLWSVFGEVSPYIARWGSNLWRYTQYTESQEPIRLEPATRDDCATGGFRAYGFANHGSCVAYVQAGRSGG